EIDKLKDRVKVLEDKEDVAVTQSGDDALIKGRSINEGETAAEKISNDLEEVARVLTSMDAATVLAGGIDVPTGSGFIPTAGPPATVISTDSESQQRRPITKKQKREYYMAVIRSNLGWRVKDFKGMTFEEIEAKFAEVWKHVENFIPMGSKEETERLKRKGLNLEQEQVKRQKSSKEAPEIETSTEEFTKDKIKKMMQLVPVEDDLVKEYLTIRPATSDKEMELWVELKRMYEPDPKDQLWTLTQNFMHAPIEWKLYDLSGVHHLTAKDKEIFMLVEKDYPLSKSLAFVMTSYKLQVMLKYEVTHRLSTAYHPQTSGQVEVSNCGLKRILKRTIEENRASWSDKLDDALWAFRTAYKTPIGCTPYKLVYGKACHLPIELEHKAYWALKHAKFDLSVAGAHRKDYPDCEISQIVIHKSSQPQLQLGIQVMLKYGVTHHLSTAYHPQTSGQVEVTNRGLKRILGRTVGENRALWGDKLEDALWAFRIAFKTPIVCTPYRLVYEKSCHLPLELEHKAFWALKHTNFDLKTTGDHRKRQLNELSELRDQAYENSLIYKERTKKLHDAKIKNRIFNVGDQVLLFNSRLKIFSGKLKSRWSGPFTISEVYPYEKAKLVHSDGSNFKVNCHRLKHYHEGDAPPLEIPDFQTFPKDN
nr:reverse transcriptase domain-containing protein [Tanacetum cinerariifolium]